MKAKTTYIEVVINATISETYKCGRGLNNRGDLMVWVYKNSRWDTRTRTKVTAKQLTDDGWNLSGRIDTAKL